MAEFWWKQVPPHGSCTICGSTDVPRGFVDFIGDTVVFNRETGTFVGVVDIYICATCIEQASRLVGCADREQVDGFAYREFELVTENERLKDELLAERERFEQLVNKLTEEVKAGISATENILED